MGTVLSRQGKVILQKIVYILKMSSDLCCCIVKYDMAWAPSQ